MSDDMTRQDYWAAIEEVGRESIEEYPEDEEERQQWIQESVDGHQYIIYTWRNRKVLEYTEHPDAYTEAFGQLPENAKTLDEAYAPCAYMAMEADVMEWIGLHEDEVKEEMEAEA